MSAWVLIVWISAGSGCINGNVEFKTKDTCMQALADLREKNKEWAVVIDGVCVQR